MYAFLSFVVFDIYVVRSLIRPLLGMSSFRYFVRSFGL